MPRLCRAIYVGTRLKDQSWRATIWKKKLIAPMLLPIFGKHGNIYLPNCDLRGSNYQPIGVYYVYKMQGLTLHISGEVSTL
jgi:hypothetical protein